MFNAARAEIIRNLIGGAALAIWNTKERFHVANFEV